MKRNRKKLKLESLVGVVPINFAVIAWRSDLFLFLLILFFKSVYHFVKEKEIFARGVRIICMIVFLRVFSDRLCTAQYNLIFPTH